MSALNRDGIVAVARRQLGSFLGNPLGYVFILAFVLVASALMYWFGGEKYFARNIADLGPLVDGNGMAWLLAVLVPALAMGAWAAEREQGTEELLMTMPLTALDAVLGKFLAIVAFTTVALACSLSNVAVLMWQGSPDLGLVLANYIGWWLAAVSFAALGLLGSVLVSMPAVAFVVGVVLCAAAMWSLGQFHFFDAFARGVVPLGSVAVAFAIAAAAIGACVFVLESRRWRPDAQQKVAAQVLSLLFAVMLVANLARLAARGGVDADVSAEGLSSLSDYGRQALAEVKSPVTVTAFISRNLPPDLAAKGQEVESKLKALERAAPGRITLTVRRPADPLDADGTAATQEFSLKPRRQVVDSAAGRRFDEVFLGAAVSSAGRTQVIEHFDPGLSVEYELVRAVRAVSNAKKRVLGIATTDLDIMGGGFNYQTMQAAPGWEIVEEWRKQYDVQGVSLDSEVKPEIEVLVVPQPSTLTQEHIERLHDYVWAGRPALLLEDPLPFFQLMQNRGDLVPGQPKKSAQPQQQNPFGPPPPQDGPQKGDLRPLLRALGLDYDQQQAVWSDYNPSHYFRELIPQSFVWCMRQQGGFEAQRAVTTGIGALLLPYPGGIRVAKDKDAGLEVVPLVTPSPRAPWGRNLQGEITDRNWMGGGLQLKDPNQVRRRTERNEPPALMVEVTGVMPSAFPRPDPSTAMPAKDGQPAKEAERRVGVKGAKPAHVIVLADLDLVDNEFFQFYRNQGNRIKDDELRVLLDLRNVQLVANAVDALMNDQAYLALRTNRLQPHPLTRLESVRLATQELRRSELEKAQQSAQDSIDAINKAFQDKLAEIDQRTDIDEATKAQERARAEISGRRKADTEISAINLKREEQERTLNISQEREVRAYIQKVQRLAVLVPSAVLAALALLVLVAKVWRERTHIPASRIRGK